MEKLILLVITAICMSFTTEEKGILLSYQKEKSVFDESLGDNESKYTFRFTGILDANETRQILFSIDAVQYREALIDNDHIEVRSTPGKHVFQFYYDDSHFEISTDSLQIAPQHHDYYSVFFENTEHPIIVDKPVIYLYPENRQKVHVSLEPKGSDLFEYPKFNNLRNDLLSWSFTANPNGNIELEGESYNYLFWEAKQDARLLPEDQLTGFVVQGQDIADFFEKELRSIGFTSKERADFITYWAPRMRSNKANFIHFMFNNRCDEFAKYIIEPKPENFYRLYISWTQVDEKLVVKEQKMIPLKRHGFTVIEWGGFEYNSNFSQANNQ